MLNRGKLDTSGLGGLLRGPWWTPQKKSEWRHKESKTSGGKAGKHRDGSNLERESADVLGMFFINWVNKVGLWARRGGLGGGRGVEKSSI